MLTGLDEIKLGVGYRINGVEVEMPPAQLEELGEVSVEYVRMKGWKEDISGCKRFEELPGEAQRYVEKIEELSGVSVSWIGNGAQREKMILK